MKKIITIILITVIILAAGAYLYINKQVETNLPTTDNNSFPVLDVPNGNVSVGAGPLTISTAAGNELTVVNFLTSSISEKDENNPGYYSIGYNLIEAEKQNVGFYIEYQTETSFFNVILLDEPLAKVRQEAEQYLKNTLKLNDEEMCALRYTVGVPRTVNEYFAGGSLGFSFCPGSVELE